MASHIKITKDGLRDSPSKGVDVPYKELLGSLIYAATTTRIDIAFAVSKLASYSSSPKLVHWNLLKNIAQYLIGRENEGLICRRNGNNKISLRCFCDADFAGCEDTRRSTSGFIITLDDTPVIFKSKKQSLTSGSTCESEFIAAALATNELLWLRNLLLELGACLDPTAMFIDKLGTVKLIENNQVHAKTKHLDVKLFKVREQNNKTIKIIHIDSENNLSDILTSVRTNF